MKTFQAENSSPLIKLLTGTVKLAMQPPQLPSMSPQVHLGTRQIYNHGGVDTNYSIAVRKLSLVGLQLRQACKGLVTDLVDTSKQMRSVVSKSVRVKTQGTTVENLQVESEDIRRISTVCLDSNHVEKTGVNCQDSKTLFHNGIEDVRSTASVDDNTQDSKTLFHRGIEDVRSIKSGNVDLEDSPILFLNGIEDISSRKSVDDNLEDQPTLFHNGIEDVRSKKSADTDLPDSKSLFQEGIEDVRSVKSVDADEVNSNNNLTETQETEKSSSYVNSDYSEYQQTSLPLGELLAQVTELDLQDSQLYVLPEEDQVMDSATFTATPPGLDNRVTTFMNITSIQNPASSRDDSSPEVGTSHQNSVDSSIQVDEEHLDPVSAFRLQRAKYAKCNFEAQVDDNVKLLEDLLSCVGSGTLSQLEFQFVEAETFKIEEYLNSGYSTVLENLVKL